MRSKSPEMHDFTIAAGRGGVAVGEFDAVAGELIKVRCMDVGICETAQVAVTEVVAEQHDDVRLSCFSG